MDARSRSSGFTMDARSRRGEEDLTAARRVLLICFSGRLLLRSSEIRRRNQERISCLWEEKQEQKQEQERGKRLEVACT